MRPRRRDFADLQADFRSPLLELIQPQRLADQAYLSRRRSGAFTNRTMSVTLAILLQGVPLLRGQIPGPSL